MKIGLRLAVVASLVLVLALSGGASAQPSSKPSAPAATISTSGTTSAASKEKDADEGFIDTVNVSVVNVDVYATDKKTHSFVKGLNKGDFELYEDGQPVAITNFYSIENFKGQGDDTPVANPAVPPDPTHPAPPVPEDQRLRLIVYIDNFNLLPFDRNRIMQKLRIFLDQKVHRDDQVMLATYDKELHVRQNFTSDPSLVNHVLVDLEKVSAQGVHSDSDRREVLRQIDEAQSPDEAVGYARAYAGALYNDVQGTIDGLHNLVTMLAGMPGRKAILYVSEGLPRVAGYDVFYAIQDKYGVQSGMSMTETTQWDSTRKLDELTAAANADRITFYTIDAGGLRVLQAYTAQNARPGAGAQTDQMFIQNNQDSIQTMAEKTGGLTVINTNDVGPSLDRISADFGSFYSLGYTPTHHGDGRFHKITVRVKKKGIDLRHREGYRDKTTETEMNEVTLAALQFPFEENPIGLTMQFGRPSQRPDGFYQVPVSVRIPLAKILLVPRAKSHEGRLKLFIAAMDKDGQTSDVGQASVPISIPVADVPTITNKYFTYTMTLLMRPGEQRVSVGLRDELAAQHSVVTGGLRLGT
jgi:VWFA-related protein